MLIGEITPVGKNNVLLLHIHQTFSISNNSRSFMVYTTRNHTSMPFVNYTSIGSLTPDVKNFLRVLVNPPYCLIEHRQVYEQTLFDAEFISVP